MLEGAAARRPATGLAVSWRYQRRSLYAERGGVLTFEGVDPLTGLPVLIYRFVGAPQAALRHLESENIPGLLGIAKDGEFTQVAVAYSRDYRPLASPSQLAPAIVLRDSARALRDAAEAGVLHGDICPARFLASATHLLLEGFGIPWQLDDGEYRAPELRNEASYAGDVYAWAKSLLSLGLALSERQRELLARCLHEDPEVRPTAEAIYRALTAELDALAPSLDAPAGDALAELDGALSARELKEEFDLDDFDEPAALSAVFAPKAPADAAEPDPLVIISDPGRRVAAPPQAREGSFVKTLPPGATYRPGSAAHDVPPGKFIVPEPPAVVAKKPRQWRNVLRLVAIALVAVAVVVLIVLQRQATPAVAPAGASVTNYIVEVIIEPVNLPPVGLYVVSAPEGTRTPAGAQIGSYQPGRSQIVLDRAGEWRFQVRFEDRASEVVALQLPEERSLRFTLAEEEATP